MREKEINAFLTHLAVEGKVSASTQTQALCALLFLYRPVLGLEVGELEGLVRARRKRKLPVVLSPEEVKGHQSVQTTMIYTHVLNRGGRSVQSPIDRLNKTAPR